MSYNVFISSRISLTGYSILYAIARVVELALVMPIPLWVPIYTEDGITTKNPAVGYYDVMFAPVCYDTPQGLLGEACFWDHGPNNQTVLDNESVSSLYIWNNRLTIFDFIIKAQRRFG